MTAASLLLARVLVWQRQSFEVALQKRRQAICRPGCPTTGRSRVVSTKTAAGIGRREIGCALRQANNGYSGIRYAALTRGVNAIETAGSAIPASVDLAGELRTNATRHAQRVVAVGE